MLSQKVIALIGERLHDIMWAFVRLRELLIGHKDLSRKLSEMERKYDSQFKLVFDAIRQLITPAHPPRRRVGFEIGEGKKR